MANRLHEAMRTRILSYIAEGLGTRAIGRMTGVSKVTIGNLQKNAGIACQWLHDLYARDVKAPTIECDELWSFIGARDKNVEAVKRGTKGPVWTWLAFDPKTKLVIHWWTGDRSAEAADQFFFGLSERLAGPALLHTDECASYVAAIGHHPMLQHRAVHVHGKTNGTERMNLTIRSGLRRFVRRTTGYSKTLAAHRQALSYFFFYYNFARPHSGLRGDVPAVRAGLIPEAWTTADIEEAVTALWAIEPHGKVWSRIAARAASPAPTSFGIHRPIVTASKSRPSHDTEVDHAADKPVRRFKVVA